MVTYGGDVHVPTHIFEAAALHFTLKVSCIQCGNFAVFDAAGVWWYFKGKRWNDELRTAHQHFYCASCTRISRRRVGAKPLQAVKDKANKFLPWPDQREWKRAISRFRL